MKAAVVGMLNNVGSSTSHHGGGYYHVMMNILKAQHPGDLHFNPDPSTWNEYERIYILEGVNYQENIFNFIGGPQPEHRAKIEAMANYKGLAIAVNVPIDLNIFNKRFGVDHQFAAINCLDFARLHGNTTRKLVRGDSHSLSVWKPGFGLDRTDGKTLFGFLKDADTLVDTWNEQYDEVVIPSTTATSTASLTTVEVPMNIALPAGYIIYVTILAAATAGYHISAVGGHYTPQ